MKEVEKQLITKIITQDFGISMHLKGGHYIEEAAILALQNPSIFVMEIESKIINNFNENVDEITDRCFFSQEKISLMIKEHKITDGFTLGALSILKWRK